MISNAIFSPSQCKLYPWLFGQPARAFHLSELRRLSGLGSASLQREINRLLDAGLVEARQVGNMRQFQANSNAPIFSEIVAITAKTLGLVPILRAALLKLQSPPMVGCVYGSVARGTDTANSDIDLLLIGDNLHLVEVLAALEPARQQLSRPINPACYSPEDFKKRQNEPDSFVSRLLTQPILALIGDLHEFAGTR
jgi:DNA-binding transcriptional ArsR family regulator